MKTNGTFRAAAIGLAGATLFNELPRIAHPTLSSFSAEDLINEPSSGVKPSDLSLAQVSAQTQTTRC